MSRKKAKPGAIFIHSPDDPRGDLLAALSETLGYLDSDAEKKLRAQHGPAFLYMADAGVRGDDDDWYEQAPRAWQLKLDALLNTIVSALQKTAPPNHQFGAITGDDGMIEWGYWEAERKNPQEEAEEDLLYGGFRENAKPVLVQQGPQGSIFKYRGRHILIDGSNVQIARSGKGMSALLAEWESNQPFPKLEAMQVVDLMYEQAKGRKRQRKHNPVLPATVAQDMQVVGPKCAGVLFKCRGYFVELQPIGEYDGGDLTTYEGMTSATVIGPDDVVVQSVPAWGGARALEAAKKVIDKQAKAEKDNPKASRRGKKLSFMRRMMNI